MNILMVTGDLRNAGMTLARRGRPCERAASLVVAAANRLAPSSSSSSTSSSPILSTGSPRPQILFHREIRPVEPAESFPLLDSRSMSLTAWPKRDSVRSKVMCSSNFSPEFYWLRGQGCVFRELIYIREIYRSERRKSEKGDVSAETKKLTTLMGASSMVSFLSIHLIREDNTALDNFFNVFTALFHLALGLYFSTPMSGKEWSAKRD